MVYRNKKRKAKYDLFGKQNLSKINITIRKI